MAPFLSRARQQAVSVFSVSFKLTQMPVVIGDE
jgi:hypothetical protein